VGLRSVKGEGGGVGVIGEGVVEVWGLLSKLHSTAHSPQHTVKTLTQVEAQGKTVIVREGGETAIFLFQNSNPCIIIGHQ
jgi:hypothetical protein